MNTTEHISQQRDRLIELSDKVFSNQEKSRRWLHKPLVVLKGKAPIDMLDTAEGARIVEDLLGRLDEGYFS
ncbi:DUF2384 domain-containing protein [Betaproteobacteria bacterium SCN2]|jgi:putative toxin-antitoxin system antitoxin component (TIGR02293 family)|nr:DUF2384 domain-containing protein [Betaproteobacteria bacterium SCN2]